jgi:phosphate uptake regulator
MFREFFAHWRRKDLLHQALEDAHIMMAQVSEMFRFACGVLFEQQQEGVDIYRQDRIINKYEIDIRRKVLEHLSVNPQEDLASSLILTSVVIDMERIGDFAKNIVELASMYPEALEGDRYIGRLREIADKLEERFQLTEESFREADVEKGDRVMRGHVDIAHICDNILEELVRDTKIPARKAIVCALLTRYLKRISAHLKNVASSVVNPFQRIGFRPEK